MNFPRPGGAKTISATQEKELAARIVLAAQETKAHNILLYNMDNRSSIADFFMICSGRSQAHVRGIAERIEESLRLDGVRCGSIEGLQEGSWVLLDYGVVIVHVFHPETRSYYDLEGLLASFSCRNFPETDALYPAAEGSG